MSEASPKTADHGTSTLKPHVWAAWQSEQLHDQLGGSASSRRVTTSRAVWDPGPIEAERRADLLTSYFDPAARFFTNLTGDPWGDPRSLLNSVYFTISDAW